MKNAIILHGMPSRVEYEQHPHQTEKHWLPWIKQQLITQGIATDAPELPQPYEPNYQDWKQVFEQFPITNETVLIGHSAGAGFLVRWLSENNVQVGKVVLVAPWMDPENYLQKTYGHSDFFNFAIDRDFPKRTQGTVIFVSDDDERWVLETVQTITQQCPDILVKQFHNHGHFTFDDMGTIEFPELLQEILK